ncbi:Txe/YoeB family addiction module toxin [Campylobacter sp. MOP7]|uniref:Txe/YoeB family addiction module toxin n=1 Tax=Campylobacter canis TaxID=3378588 RepID=UPI00387E460B
MLNIEFYPDAWSDYLELIKDKKILAKINTLIKDIARNENDSNLGKPETLKGALAGCYSRRIDIKNRIVYRIRDNSVQILQVGTHYKQK